MTSDAEAQLRSELARLNPLGRELPHLKNIAAIGSRGIDFAHVHNNAHDSRIVHDSLLCAARSGMAVDPDFEITTFALPERNFLQTRNVFDMAILLYIPGQRTGCTVYNGAGHDELNRADPAWNRIVAPGHTPSNWQKVLRKAGVKCVAAFGGINELTVDMLTSEQARAEPYIALRNNPPYECNGHADQGINLPATYKKHADVPGPWLGFCIDQSYLQKIAPWLGNTAIARAAYQAFTYRDDGYIAAPKHKP